MPLELQGRELLAAGITRGYYGNSDATRLVFSVHKFGGFTAIGTSPVTVTDLNNSYPWPTSALTVNVKAGGNAADDDDGGAGARTVIIEGLDETWTRASETLTLAGADASAASTTTFIRVFRAYVDTVGTYSAANTAAITLETSGATEVAKILAGKGQTQMGLYTIPANYTGFLRHMAFSVDGNKTGTIAVYRRERADDVSAPFAAKRLVHEEDNLQGHVDIPISGSIVFPEKTDIWVEANASSGTVAADVELDILCIPDI